MNKLIFIINFEVKYHKVGSILDTNTRSIELCYLPLREKEIDYSRYWDYSNHCMIDNALVELGGNESGCYLVKEPIVTFDICSSFVINNDIDEPNEIHDSEVNYIKKLFNSIKDEITLRGFSNLGICKFNVSCVVEERWSRDMDDYNSHVNYIGVVDNNLDPIELVTKKDKNKIKSRKKKYQETLF